MCGGGGDGGQSAAQQEAIEENNRLLEEQAEEARVAAEKAAAEEVERKAKIEQNVLSINDAFSQFDDEFFGQARDATLDFFIPQLSEQFEDAQRDVALNLADRGLSDSSVAGKKARELKDLFEDENQRIQSLADENAQKLKADVGRQRSTTTELARAGQGLDSVDDILSPALAQISVPQTFSPLGDIFTSLTGDLATLQKAGLIPTSDRLKTNTVTGANEGGSARVVT